MPVSWLQPVDLHKLCRWGERNGLQQRHERQRAGSTGLAGDLRPDDRRLTRPALQRPITADVNVDWQSGRSFCPAFKLFVNLHVILWYIVLTIRLPTVGCNGGRVVVVALPVYRWWANPNRSGWDLNSDLNRLLAIRFASWRFDLNRRGSICDSMWKNLRSDLKKI